MLESEDKYLKPKSKVTVIYFHFSMWQWEKHNIMMHAMDQIQLILGSVTYSESHSAAHICADVLKNYITSSVPGSSSDSCTRLAWKRFSRASDTSLIIKEQCGSMLFWGVLELTQSKLKKNNNPPPFPSLAIRRSIIAEAFDPATTPYHLERALWLLQQPNRVFDSKHSAFMIIWWAPGWTYE